MKETWQNGSEIILATLTQRKQHRKKSIKKSHNISDLNERNTASLKLNKLDKYRRVSLLKRPKGKTIKLCHASL